MPTCVGLLRVPEAHVPCIYIESREVLYSWLEHAQCQGSAIPKITAYCLDFIILLQ